MTSGPGKRVSLVLVNEEAAAADASARQQKGADGSRPCDIDRSILMARAQAGDGEAYRRLLDEITPFLRRLAARRHREPSDAEDAVQDILLTLHAVRNTYDSSRPFTPWLVAIANHRLVDRLRRQGRLRAREAPLAAEHETFPAERTNLDNEISDRRQLREALETLPAGQRQAIQLLKLEELSLKEASAATGMSVMALKVATHRAMKALRKLIPGGSKT
jgi:RNA polymerase sigma-70 factor, ECF subfamily